MPGRGEASLDRLIEGVLADLDLRTRFREQLAIASWPQIVGQVVAEHSRADAVRDGVLIVATDTSAWANELQMRQRELLDLVARRIGSGVIREIHFRTGLRRRGRRSPAPGPLPSEIRLSRRQERHIGEAAAKIEDDDLRGRAERAFASLARVSEWRKRAGWRRCRRCGRWQRVGRRWCSSCTYSGRRRGRR